MSMAAPDTALLYVLRKRSRIERTEIRLRARRMRRLRRADRRRRRALMRDSDEGCVGRDIVTLEGLGSREQPDPCRAPSSSNRPRMRLLARSTGMIITTRGAPDAQSASFRERGT